MSKGGSTTSEVKVPEYIEAAAQRNLNRADKVSQLGYVPEYGPTVAAFTPNQQAAFQNTANTADAFGMSAPTSQRDIMGGMAPPTTYANGVQGYSSAPMYEQMLAELAAKRPGQKSYIDSFSIDPQTGAPGANAAAPIDYTQPNPSGNTGGGGGNTGGGGGYNMSTSSMNTPLSYMRGGVNDRNLTSRPSQFVAGATGGVSGMTEGSNNVYTRESGQTTSSTRPRSRDDSSDGCVVATHAVESGAFTPHMKREAVVWCMDVLHGKWWGEAIRRGYRYCGTKKIEQGKAREHYSEFRRYIDFASGKKRTLRGAVTFTLRTAQFFAVGLVKRDA